MATSPILTHGLGSYGSINLLPTLGFSINERAPPPIHDFTNILYSQQDSCNVSYTQQDSLDISYTQIDRLNVP